MLSSKDSEEGGEDIKKIFGKIWTGENCIFYHIHESCWSIFIDQYFHIVLLRHRFIY